MHIVAANTDHFSNPKKYYGIQDLFHIEELFSLHYFEYMSTFSFPGESHDFWEFVCVDKGEVEIGAGPLTHTLRRGEIAFHYPGEFHWVKANGKIAPNLIVISFSCTDSKNLHEQATYNRRGIQGNAASAGSGAGTGSACRNHCRSRKFFGRTSGRSLSDIPADQERYIPCLWSAYPPSFRRTSPQPLPA